MFTVFHQNTLCVFLRSNKCVECISFLRDHIQSLFLEELALFITMFVSLQSSSSLPLFVHCYVTWHRPPPTVNKWNSIKQSAFFFAQVANKKRDALKNIAP